MSENFSFYGLTKLLFMGSENHLQWVFALRERTMLVYKYLSSYAA